MLFKKRPQQAVQKGPASATKMAVDKRAEIPATDDVLAAIDAALRVTGDPGSSDAVYIDDDGESCCLCNCNMPGR